MRLPGFPDTGLIPQVAGGTRRPIAESTRWPKRLPARSRRRRSTRRHRSLGARMVEFGGWDMPVEYSGITDEHLAVRTPGRAVRRQPHGRDRDRRRGRADGRAAHHVATTPPKLAVGQIQYSALTTPEGTFVDDVLVYRLGRRALPARRQRRRTSSRTSTGSPSTSARRGDAVAVNTSSRYALHRAAGAGRARRAADADRRRPARRSSTTGSRPARSPACARTISRTGYTGEDGFEVFVPPGIGRARVGRDPAGRAGRRRDARPASARATRCGSKPRCACTATTWTRRRPCSRRTSGWIVGWKKAGVHRRRRAAPQKAGRRRRASSSASRCSIARSPGTATTCTSTAQKAGVVTSGTQTPFLKKAIGMAYVPADARRAGHGVRDRHPRPPRHARRSCRCRSTSDRSSAADGRDRTWEPHVSDRSEVHEGPRVGAHRRRHEARVGITDYAQKQLGDVVYVELPEVGRDVQARARCSARSSR